MITPRLEMILRHIKGETVADIGTDHGYVAIELAKQGKKVIATDLREKPLKAAEENAKKSGVDIDLRLGDGLEPLNEGEADCIVIAGVGCDTITKMIENGYDTVKTARLVLQPMTHQRELRVSLMCMDFRIIEEDLAKEGDRYYNLIVAERGTFKYSMYSKGPIDYLIPKLLYDHPLLEEYTLNMYHKYKRIKRELSSGREYDGLSFVEQTLTELADFMKERGIKFGMYMYEIEEMIEKEFPLETAYEWDNCGLLVGGKYTPVSKVLVTLDITYDVYIQALKNGVDLILTHHPILFNGIKKINQDTEESQMIAEFLRRGICVYAAHTTCDVGKNGINAYLAELIGLSNVENLEENGLGRVGDLKEYVKLGTLARRVRKLLGTPHVRVCGNPEEFVKRVAVGSGACADSIPKAKEKHANVMITSDVKYHEALKAQEMHVNLIDAGHFPTEFCVTEIFEKMFEDMGVEVIKAEQRDVFTYI